MRKKLAKLDNLEERKEHYKSVSLWLKSHNIPFKKLVIGLQVDVSEIPEDKIDEWIEISTFKKT